MAPEACPIFRVMATGIRRKNNVAWRFRSMAAMRRCGNAPMAAIHRDLPLENPDGTRSLALA
jgi:hypothetical protein